MSENAINKDLDPVRQIVMLPVGEVLPYEKNPRKNAKAIKYVKESIRKFGFKQPIVVDYKRVVICGHTRLEAAKSLGMDEVPCIVANDLTDAQVKALRLADNKVAEFSEWDDPLLNDELLELADISDIDMGDFGFGEIEGLDDEEAEKKEADVEKEASLTDCFQVIVECSDEEEQQAIFEKLSGEGLKCRLSTL